MPDKFTEFARAAMNEMLASMTLEQRLEGATMDDLRNRLSIEERLKGLPVEDRLKGVSIEELIQALSPEFRAALARQFGNKGPSKQ